MKEQINELSFRRCKSHSIEPQAGVARLLGLRTGGHGIMWSLLMRLSRDELIDEALKRCIHA